MRANQTPLPGFRKRITRSRWSQYLNLLCVSRHALQKLIDGGGQRCVASQVSLSDLIRVVEANCICDFFATKDRFNFIFALRLLTKTRSSCQSKESQHGHQSKQGYEHVTCLRTSSQRFAAGRWPVQ